MNENDLKKIKLMLVFLLIFFGMTAGVFKQLQQLNEEENIKKREQQEQEALLESLKSLEESIKNQKQATEKAEEARLTKERQKVDKDENVPSEEEQTADETESAMSTQEAMEAGLREKNSGNYKKAIDYFKIALKDSNKEIQKNTYKNIIECYASLNDTYGKIEMYQNMANSESDETTLKKIYQKIAEEYNVLGDLEKSLEYYKKSYKIEPTSAMAMEICEIYKKLNELEEMDAFISRHLNRFPQDRSSFRNLAR